MHGNSREYLGLLHERQPFALWRPLPFSQLSSATGTIIVLELGEVSFQSHFLASKGGHPISLILRALCSWEHMGTLIPFSHGITDGHIYYQPL